MGDEADDLKNSFHLEDEDDDDDDDDFDENHATDYEYDSEDRKRLGKDFNKSFGTAEYEVRILHRRTLEVKWTGTVIAHSKLGAQAEFRRQFPHIRSQYTHEYALGIKKKM